MTEPYDAYEINEFVHERNVLKAINADLLTALDCLTEVSTRATQGLKKEAGNMGYALAKARAAIAKARGE